MMSFEFWYWLILGAVLLTLEMLAPGVVLMWFGFGAVLTGVVLWIFPELSLGWQLLLFGATSILSLYAWRQSKFFRDPPPMEPELNNRLLSHIGKRYVLNEAIIQGSGSLKIGDSTWRVRGKDLPAGTKVEVVGVEGIILLVEAV
ncbi:NfeD family protein [uncultured Thiothrix sp.]|uniref:NfeD family protein n=1 Tax=uncultured Thiothrix sp. TaxID=223185 RepID=UPI00261F04A1|nr:NfeD family protein [uncultured Thiothrix sp.]HMT92439.1 NfeD family protein [Thiolinea sp.]